AAARGARGAWSSAAAPSVAGGCTRVRAPPSNRGDSRSALVDRWEPALQLLRPVEPGQVAVERTQRKVSRLPCDLEHEAIGESQRRLLPEVLQRRGHGVGVLQRQVLVAEKHLDCGGEP